MVTGTQARGHHGVRSAEVTAWLGAKRAIAPSAEGAGGPVPGRPFEVIVDYAHTPDALANVLRTARGRRE